MFQHDLINTNHSTFLQCNTAAEELDQKYDFMVYNHRDSDTATLVTGYSGDDHYDSYFILSKDDLINFRDTIDEAIKKFDHFKNTLKHDKVLRETLLDRMTEMAKDFGDNKIHITVTYRELIDCDPHESLFGTVLVEFAYDNYSTAYSKAWTMGILLSREEFLSDVKDLSFFEPAKDIIEFVVTNPAEKDVIESNYQQIMATAGDTSNDYGLPAEITKEDINELKANMLARIDEMIKK